MKRIYSSHLSDHLNMPIRLRGFLHTVRSFGKLNFLLIRDQEGCAQVVVQDPEEYRKIAHLQPGSIITVHGTVIQSSQAGLGFEVVDPKIHVEVSITLPPPIDYYKPEISSDLESILDNRPLSLRNRKIQAVFKIQAEIAHAYRLYMHDQVRAVEYFPPNIIGASSEGGSEFFNVDYFGYTATLAQSSQLYKQVMVGVNERAYAITPFFRAEQSHTPRHLAEGKQMEFEMGFFDDWHEILDVQEGAIKSILRAVHVACATEIALLGGQIVTAPIEIPFPRITFQEAQELYFKRTLVDEREEPDLSPAAERELCKWALEQYGTELLFVTDWKVSKRPFYSYPSAKDSDLTNTFDLLCAGTEITSGGQRRHTYESMLEGLLLKGMNPDNFLDYLSIFHFGMPPHGGFGMGLERLTMTLLKLKNIREASLFPSDPKRIAGNRIKAKIFFGGENIRNEIIRLLKDREMGYEYLVHETTPTSEDSARARATKQEEGVKALLLRGKSSKKNYQFNLPSHLKLDMKQVADIVGEKCEFEDPEVIFERFGLIIGGVPPFGTLLNLPTYYDTSIKSLEKVAFNCGLPTESIVMRGEDLLALVEPMFASFSKS